MGNQTRWDSVTGIREMWKDLGRIGPHGEKIHGQVIALAQTLRVLVVGPTVVYSGVTAVAVPTTRVVLGASTGLGTGVQIRAHSANLGTIYVGGAAVAAANGYRLLAGETVFVAAHNVNDIWLDATVGADAVSWLAS